MTMMMTYDVITTEKKEERGGTRNCLSGKGAWPTIAVSILLDLQVGNFAGNNEVFVEGLHFHPTNVPGGAWAQESNLRQGGREANLEDPVKAKTDTAYMQQARQEP